MLTVNLYQSSKEQDTWIAFSTLPIAIELQPISEFEELIADLSLDRPWYDRKIAATKLGYTQNAQALHALLAALPNDPFWMVRCAMIQALEMIADPIAIPTLQEVATRDGFQAVRSYAMKAIDRLSREV
jgi:HEAT repeat protein